MLSGKLTDPRVNTRRVRATTNCAVPAIAKRPARQVHRVDENNCTGRAMTLEDVIAGNDLQLEIAVELALRALK